MKKLTSKQQWMLDFLRSEDSGNFISPAAIGREYSYFKKGHYNQGYHNVSASPTMKQLLALGLIERNYAGYYRATGNYQLNRRG